MKDDNYAEGFVHSIIYKEIVLPEFEKANKGNTIPDWNALSLVIRKKYNDYYAARIIIGAKSSWGSLKKNWSEYIKYYVLFFDQYDLIKGSIMSDGREDFKWNSIAWEVFKYSNDKEELTKALNWSKHAVMMNPVGGWMDTYANILYKLGYENLAVSWEELAVKQSPTDKDIQTNLEKMKKNEPTWPLR
jgi:hypothetical protein